MSARLSGDREAGFTLIELLVVMLILGILAAIAIPAFFNQRDKATDAEAKSMARSAQTAMETWATESGGVYNAALPAEFDSYGELLADIEPTIQADRVTVTETSATGYTVTAESDIEGQEFEITRNGDGTTTFDCEVEGEGGCPRGGNWGQ
ncbi:MAG TPA: type II secretion system protein [Solirubrobacterales bacterium]|nr:type II secretion system protein [Solirubrobacterales bacterium]